MTEPREAHAPAEEIGEALVLLAVESGLMRTLLWTGLRHSGFVPALVGSVEEARAVLEAHGRRGVLLVDGERLVEEGLAWRSLAEEEPPLALVALRVDSRSAFAGAWAAELGCECLEEPLDLGRVLQVLRRSLRARRAELGAGAALAERRSPRESRPRPRKG